MELEFDKEIDAILRRGRASAGASAPASGHLDADAIAAFAENALPASARVLYYGHLADCDRCRTQLSQAILMNREADAAAASTIWPPVEKAVPWYSKIFRMPSLALAMGSLVLVFSGVLGYVLLQRQAQEASNGAVVSQAPTSANVPGSYYTSEPSAAANTNAAVSANTAAANTTAQPDVLVPTGTATASGNGPSASSAEEAKAPVAVEKEAATEDRKGYELDGVASTVPAKPDTTTLGAGGRAPAAAAAPPPADQPKTDRDEKLAEAGDDLAKDKSKVLNEASRSRMDREAMPPAAKKEGPSRAGPLNTQQQYNTNMGEMAVTRHVGGRTFTNKNGAWVDSAYSGQSTTAVRRGSDEFKKLDSGLRSIANELYGTVIVVWKGKAYRIV